MTDETLQQQQENQEDPTALKAEIERLRQHNATLLGEKKTVQSRAAELEQMQAEAEQKRLEANQEHEKLWRQEKDRADKLQAKDIDRDKRDAENQRAAKMRDIAKTLSPTDAKRQSSLEKHAADYISITPDGLKISGKDGDMTEAQLLQLLSSEFPFLVDGNQSSGGGAPGSKTGSGADPSINAKAEEAKKKGDLTGFLKAQLS